MQQPTIDVLSTEANRLLDLSIQFLNYMNEQKGVVAAAMQGENQTFDQASLAKHIEVLQGEKTKLANLDMVLAVIGTMKAGKSTTINAIIGSEVLPNRNRPMTALPTLIRHTPKQIEPLLKFDNNGPINQLLAQLSPLLNKPEVANTLAALADNPDMHELLQRIQERKLFSTRYEGADNIFWFLKSLNDLVRLCQELEVDFPFEHYDEVHEMPVIEVEFAHLRHMPETRGRLTLLDTPGPNEAGQTHLRVMMKEQLAKASAILAVMNYGQLKSDADDEVREQLKSIASTAQGRLYALVNKYDEKDRNGDGEEAIKRLVAGTLMKGVIDEAHVFPVSARRAYLANRALHELDLHGKLPPYSKEAWVEDFGEEAIGRRWESKIDDIEEVRDAAIELWQESLFNIPMERVIQTAHSQAAAYAIDAAASKLVDITQKLNNFLSLRESALSRNAEDLQRQIVGLLEDSHKIDGAEKEANKLADNTLKHIDSSTANILQRLYAEMEASLEEYFKEGQVIAKKQQELEVAERKQEPSKKKESQVIANKQQALEVAERKQEPSKKDESEGLLSMVVRLLTHRTAERSNTGADFDPRQTVLKFSDRSEAEELLKRISNSIERIMKSGEEALITTIQQQQDDFRKSFEGNVGDMVGKLVAAMKDRLSGAGFDLEIRLPTPRFPSLQMTGVEMLESMVQEKSKMVTRSRRKSGAWGTVCSWFGSSDWGWEDYETTEEFYEIDLPKIRKRVTKELAHTFEQFNQSLTMLVQQPLEREVQDYFANFRSKVENIRADMQQGIRDKQGSKAEQEALANSIANLRKDLPRMMADCDELAADLRPILQQGA